ncbi:MAG: hypothetical protein ACRDI2_07435 [Chloroflexota bacterium]
MKKTLELPKGRTTPTPATAPSAVLAEDDVARAIHNPYFPTEEPERSRALLERVRMLQHTAGRLRDEAERYRAALLRVREATTDRQLAALAAAALAPPQPDGDLLVADDDARPWLPDLLAAAEAASEKV